jgi:membrane protease YdiL (CAAX protease family)
MIRNNKFYTKPWFFFVIVLIYSWSFWLVAVFSGLYYTQFPIFLLYALGGIGPSLWGIILVYLSKTKEEIKDFWKRSYDFKQIGFRWYIIILLITSCPLLLAIGFDILLGGLGASIDVELFSSVLNFIPYFLFLIIAVLSEEFGWRGYALDELQKNNSSFLSSVIIGFIWATWHIPLFLIKGTYQYELGLGTPNFWLFIIVLIPDSIIYTWIFNNNSRSILSAILYHLATNFFGEIFISISTRIQFIRFIILAFIVVYVVLPAKKKEN